MWRNRAGRGWALLAGVFAALTLLAAGAGRPGEQLHAAGEQKLLYVAIDGGVNIYDINNGHRWLRQIKIPGSYAYPRGIQVSVATGLIYESFLYTTRARGKNEGAVVAIDLRTEKVVWAKTYHVADAIAMTPDGSKLFVGGGEGADNDVVYVVDGRTGAELDQIHVHKFMHNNLVNLAGTRAYLSSVEYNYLTVADGASHAILGRIGPFSAGIRPFTINGRETLAFVNVNHLQGFEIGDIRTGKVLHRVEVQGFPYDPETTVEDPSHGIGMTADETELWVAGAGNNVIIFDMTVMPPKQIGSVATRAIPKWIGMSIDNRYVYPGSGDVIERATRKVVARISRSKRQVEVDFRDGVPVAASDMYARGHVLGSGQPPTPTTPTSTAPTPPTPTPPTPTPPTPTPSGTPGTAPVNYRLLLPLLGR